MYRLTTVTEMLRVATPLILRQALIIYSVLICYCISRSLLYWQCWHVLVLYTLDLLYFNAWNSQKRIHNVFHWFDKIPTNHAERFLKRLSLHKLLMRLNAANWFRSRFFSAIVSVDWNSVADLFAVWERVHIISCNCSETNWVFR